MKHDPALRSASPRTEPASGPFPSGTRVRLLGHNHTLTLSVDTGTIIGPPEHGYYLVRLDAPAMYDNGVAEPGAITDIRQAWDNMEPLSGVETPSKP